MKTSLAVAILAVTVMRVGAGAGARMKISSTVAILAVAVREGTIAGEFSRAEETQERVLALALGHG